MVVFTSFQLQKHFDHKVTVDFIIGPILFLLQSISSKDIFSTAAFLLIHIVAAILQRYHTQRVTFRLFSIVW